MAIPLPALPPAKRTVTGFQSGYEQDAGDEVRITEIGLLGKKLPDPAQVLRTSFRNRCMMRLLARIAARFNEAGVPLMALKGAALNLTIYDAPSARPMLDLDLMVHPEHADMARTILENMGCLRGEALVREDFFPRFYYEIEYISNRIYRVRIDLHVRPLRPLRFSRLIPSDAFWSRAEVVYMGRVHILIPCREDMLIHLAAHAAFHGFSEDKWVADIERWVHTRRDDLDWDQFLSTVEGWRLVVPVRAAMRRANRFGGDVCPSKVLGRLAMQHATWRDRLATWHAPHDNAHPARHVLVNVLTTPGLRFTIGYLRAVLLPDRRHMEGWYCRRHRAWLPCAHLVRWLWPVLRHVRRLWTRFAMTELRPPPQRGTGLFATRDIAAGETIIRARRRSRSCGKLAPAEIKTLPAIKGKLRYLNRSCRPNSELCASGLVARRRIPAGTEITIICEEAGCGLALGELPVHCPVPSKAIGEAA